MSEVENWHQGSAVGLNETGLYRVSGTLTEILELKRLVDKEPVLHAELLKNRDIHALTGTLRVYSIISQITRYPCSTIIHEYSVTLLWIDGYLNVFTMRTIVFCE